MENNNKISESKLTGMPGEEYQPYIEILYDNYSNILYGMIKRIVKTDSLAEVVLVESFVKINDSKSQFDPTRTELLTWMISIARKLALSKIAMSSETSVIPAGIKTAIPDSTYHQGNLELMEIKSKIEAEYRDIIDLFFFDGLVSMDVARKLNLPLGTIKTRAHAAISKMSEIYNSKQ